MGKPIGYYQPDPKDFVKRHPQYQYKQQQSKRCLQRQNQMKKYIDKENEQYDSSQNTHGGTYKDKNDLSDKQEDSNNQDNEKECIKDSENKEDKPFSQDQYDIHTEHYKQRVNFKPPLPKLDEQPRCGLVSNKNYINTNAIKAILSKARKPCQPSMPYILKRDFGQVPNYLHKNKQRIESEKAKAEEYSRMKQRQELLQNLTQLSNEDRSELLKHLKIKWSDINTSFQKLTFTLDTPAKKARKEEYEIQLAEIEKDIKLLSRGDQILVVDDDAQ